jgi:cold shock CspA family protein
LAAFHIQPSKKVLLALKNHGTLRFFNHERSFGFIRNDAGQDDFVHRNQLQASQIHIESLRNDTTRLAYDVEVRSNGKSQAINLSIIEE